MTAAVVLDDLLAAQWRDAATAPPAPGEAPTIDPMKVRLIKISAEGTDSRVLNGMRRLLSHGRVPFLIFVYNEGHVRGQGCDPAELITTLTEHGYKLYHAGVYITSKENLRRFLAGMTGRSTELLFVGPGHRFY